MHTSVALLDRTRNFFDIGNSASLLFSKVSDRLITFVNNGKRVVDDEMNGRNPSPPPRKQMGWLATALIAPVAFGAAYESLKPVSPSSESAEHAPNANASKTVAIDRPMQNSSSSITLPATFRPWQTATLHARVNGYLAAWHYDLGATVNAGEVMAEIETPELDQELATAVALVREADAATAQAKAERAEAEADLKVADAQLVRVKAEAELSRSQLVRREDLLQRKIITREEFDTFSTLVETRTSEVAAAESDVVRRRTNLETRNAVIEARIATAKSRQAAAERLQELQSFKRIIAPFDGVVVRRTAEVGSLVTAGQAPLFVLEDLSRVRVQVNVPQTYANQAGTGAKVSIRIPESASAPVEASVTRAAESIDATNRTMLAEVELENRSRQFQPGTFAQLTLRTADVNSWTIPSNTLSMRVAGPHVAVVDDQNRIELRPVRLGRDLGRRVVAIEGIRGNERLVVNPSDDLVQGLQIQVRQSQLDQSLVQR